MLSHNHQNHKQWSNEVIIFLIDDFSLLLSFPAPKAPPPIAQLGYDQLLSVLHLLPPESVFCFAATCRAFRDWAISTRSGWRCAAATGAPASLPREVSARASMAAAGCRCLFFMKQEGASAVEEGLRKGRQARHPVRAPRSREVRLTSI